MITMTELKPGWLVRLSTEITGNTTYDRTDIQTGTKLPTGALVTEWNTKRTTADPDEAEAATKIRGKCSTIIKAACSHSSRFGLLCPAEKKPALDAAVEQAQTLARAFNAQAKLTTVRVNVIAGYIAPDDTQAITSLRTEILDLVETMGQGVTNLDVDSVRDAASRAKAISNLLTPDIASTVLMAVDAAREAARKIVRAKEASTAGIVPDRNAIRILQNSRFAFLETPPNGEDTTQPVLSRATTARNIEIPWAPTNVQSSEELPI